MKLRWLVVTLIAVFAVSVDAQRPIGRPGGADDGANGTVGKRNNGVAPARRTRMIPWSAAAGKPNIQPGRSVGFFIWHEGNTVFIATTSESDKGKTFSGQIGLRGGVITGAAGMATESKDAFRQPRRNALQFRFQTHERLDGIKFQVNGGQTLHVQLRLAGRRTEHVFIGPKMIEAPRGPVVFDLSK